MTRNENEPRVNERIDVPRVLLIDADGKPMGEFLTDDAMALAQTQGLDLVEVARNSHPPVCRIIDYGRLKYEKKKKEAIARKNQVQVQLKEVKLRPKTDEHDMAFKLRHARRFLEEGNKVKLTVRFRGREMAHREIGEQQCYEIAKRCEDLGVIEARPRMEGRQMFMIIGPLKKKQPKPVKAKEAPPHPKKSKGAPPAPEAASADEAAAEATAPPADAAAPASERAAAPAAAEATPDAPAKTDGDA